ncbi:P-loop containing nucleoside triphosphate hydrolase protein, partial [Amylostereum chailletii]
MKELRKHPEKNAFGLRLVDHPMTLAVTPLTDLAHSQVKEMTNMGIKAVSLDKENIVAFFKYDKRNLLEEVRLCQWEVIIVSPERLNAPTFDKVLRDRKFSRNVVLYAVDEAHVVFDWAKYFREAYGDIPDVPSRGLHGVPILLMTATLSPMAEHRLLQKMGFLPGQYRTTRRSIERPHVRTMIRTLGGGIMADEFPELCWASKGTGKTLIYCKDYTTCWNIASYLQKLRPLDADRQKNIRIYNGMTYDRGAEQDDNAETVSAFQTDPECFTVVATIKFGMGVDVRGVDYVVMVGLPDSVEEVVQFFGRGGRDGRPAVTVLYVERSFVR